MTVATRRFQPVRAVEVQGHAHGSGYRIGGRLVLTAAHLLEGAENSCIVRWHGTKAEPGWTVWDAKRVWPPAGSAGVHANLDVALIELPERIEAARPAMLGILPDADAATVHVDMYGWPEWAHTLDDGGARAVGGRHIPATVWLSDRSSSGALLVLEPERPGNVRKPGEEGSGWAGLSGAAVVCDGLVVAVQHRHQRPDRPASLEASVLTSCFADEAFLKLLDEHAIPRVFPVASVRGDRGRRHRDRLDNLLARHRLFGGREAELAQIDRLIAERDSGYLFVSGDSGYGKTALLSNWVLRELQETDHTVCYQFLSRADDTAGKEFTFRSLCQQLIEAHQDDIPVPASLEDMQLEITRLLSESLDDGSKLVVVLDGLDEAEGWAFRPNLLPKTPAEHVHIIFSARRVAEKNWLEALGLPANVPTIVLDKLGTAEIDRLIGVAEGPGVRHPDFVSIIEQRSEGDPFYLHYLMADIRNGAIKGPGDLNALPQGLDAYLGTWWDQISSAVSVAAVKDLLGYLLVAKGPIPEDDLAEIADDDHLDGLTLREPIERINRFVIGDATGGYALAHWRFQKYMQDHHFKGSVRNAYRKRMLGYCERWRDHESPYALRHVVGYLVDDARDSAATERHQRIERLVRLVTDDTFQDAHSRQVDDPAALQRDLEQALAMAIADEGVQTLPPVAETALGLVAFRQKRLRPDPLFERTMLDEKSRLKYLERVERRLDLFAIESKWRQVVLLTLAWLAAQEQKEAARALRDRGAEGGVLDDPLPQLLAHVDAELTGAPPPVPLAPLPHVPEHPEDVFEAILNRLGGGKVSSFIGEGVINSQSDVEGVTDFARWDAPLLVAYAYESPGQGTQRFTEYIGLHATNSYVEYRNEALWIVLENMLHHPRPAWIRANLPALAKAALGGGRLDFRECVPIMLRAAEARAGDNDAFTSLESWRDRAMSEAASLIQAMGTRENGDVWGSHKRRLASLSVAFALLERRQDAEDLLDLAERVPIGYAGFQAPAWLALADSIRIVRPADQDAVDRAIEAALQAAHNIQDPTFCARTTARVMAMRSRWRSSPLPDDVGAVASRLIASPNSPEFAALHVVHETYVHRVHRPEGTLEMPADDTLWNLERNYRRALSEFQRLNPGLARDATADLHEGAEIKVPDPELPALLAARLAAETLVHPGLDGGHERAKTIASLIPLTIRNPTALDAVLGYLLWAAQPTDHATLKALRAIVDRHGLDAFFGATPPMPG